MRLGAYPELARKHGRQALPSASGVAICVRRCHLRQALPSTSGVAIDVRQLQVHPDTSASDGPPCRPRLISSTTVSTSSCRGCVGGTWSPPPSPAAIPSWRAGRRRGSTTWYGCGSLGSPPAGQVTQGEGRSGRGAWPAGPGRCRGRPVSPRARRAVRTPPSPDRGWSDPEAPGRRSPSGAARRPSV